jgi:hypothetical protein
LFYLQFCLADGRPFTGRGVDCANEWLNGQCSDSAQIITARKL